VKSASIARPEILTLKPYQAGQQVPGTIRLNANEAPVAAWKDGDSQSLNRYPEARPFTIQQRLAAMFGVSVANLLVTRGSSEAIDVLIRAFCCAYKDAIVTTPPTFEMYRVYADIQGVGMVDAPLDAGNGFRLDPQRILDACSSTTKLVFLCTPNNPTGGLIDTADIMTIARARQGKSLVVVDEAYIEFSGQTSLCQRIDEVDNLVVLRTLSKAHALAGARCGAAVANEEIVNVLGRVLPPYTFPTPVVECVLQALEHGRAERSAAAIADIIAERERLHEALEAETCVETIWPSQANFMLVRFRDLAAVQNFLREERILIRDFSSYPALKNCARITVGTAAENDALLAALRRFGEQQS